MAFTVAATSGPIATRLRGQRRRLQQPEGVRTMPVPRNAPDPEIEVVEDSIVQGAPETPPNSVTQVSQVPRRASEVEREFGNQPPAGPMPQPEGWDTWRHVRDAGVSVQELLNQKQLWEELAKIREDLARHQPAAAPHAAPSVTLSPQGVSNLHVKLSEFSLFKPQKDFTGRDEDLSAYVRKFRARAEALCVPLEAYTRLFKAQLGQAALSFANSNNITVDTPFDEMVTIMSTGPWIRELTDLSGRRRLLEAPYKNKPVHEIVKFVEDIFHKLPHEPSHADKISYLSLNLPDIIQTRTELSPSGVPWADYVAYRKFVLQIGAASQTLNPRFDANPINSRTRHQSNLSGLGPLRIVQYDRHKPPIPNQYAKNMNQKYEHHDNKRAKYSKPVREFNAGSSNWSQAAKPKKCAACGRLGHMARDSRDGKSPICKSYDPSKGPLIKMQPKNYKSQR